MTLLSRAPALCLTSLFVGCGFWLDTQAPRPRDTGIDGGLPDASSRDASSSPPDATFDGGLDAPGCARTEDCTGMGDLCNPATCVGGACVTVARDCTVFDSPCTVGVCTAGACSPMPRSSCDDMDVCTWNDACSLGAVCGGTRTDCDLRASPRYESSTTVRGGSGGGLQSDTCPVGQVMVGFEASLTTGFYSSILWQYATRCAEVSVADDLTVTLLPGARVPDVGVRGTWPGGTGTGTETRTCAPGHVVVGFDGASSMRATGSAEGPYVSQLQLRCAQLTATAAAGSIRVTPGAPVLLAVRGTRAEMPFGVNDCPSNTVAIGTELRAGEVLDAFGLRCGAIVLSQVTTAPSRGTPGATVFRDDCPFGHVPVGVGAGLSEIDTTTGLYDRNLTQLATVCAPLTLEPSGGGWVGRVNGAMGMALGVRGRRAPSASPSVLRMCEPDQVLVGYAGDGGAAITRLALRCAPVEATGALGALTFRYGSITTLAPLGERADVSFGPTDCPPGLVARGFFGSAEEVVDNLALRCAVPTFFLTPP